MGNVLAIMGSQSYLGPPVPLAPPAAGSITGTLIVPVPGSIINLTTQGSTDWAVWGYNGSNSLTPVDRKSTLVRAHVGVLHYVLSLAIIAQNSPSRRGTGAGCDGA